MRHKAKDQPRSNCHVPAMTLECVMLPDRKAHDARVTRNWGILWGISARLEQQLIHIPVGVGRIAGPARRARADHEGALHSGSIGADRIDLTGVDAGHGFLLGPQLPTRLAQGQRQASVA